MREIKYKIIMEENLKNLREGDIFIKISENETTLSNSIIEHNSLTIIKILKKVKNSNDDEYVYEMKCFSNYNMDNNPNKWEIIDTVSTFDWPSLHSISFIEHEVYEVSKDEIDNYSFVVKDDDNKIWKEAMKHYPCISSNAIVLNPKELEDFMDLIAGDIWKVCLGSLGHSF
jgi:hypothetical protein